MIPRANVSMDQIKIRHKYRFRYELIEIRLLSVGNILNMKKLKPVIILGF